MSGESDGIAALARISGLRRRDVDEIWQKVRENRATLESCRRHQFTMEDWKPLMKLKCLCCGGEMQASDVSWYVKGYVAAGGNEKDIWRD